MTEQGFFLAEEDYRELKTISARLAHFASIVFDQQVNCKSTEDTQLILSQKGAEPNCQPTAS